MSGPVALCVMSETLPGPVLLFAGCPVGHCVWIELLRHPDDCPCEMCFAERLALLNVELNNRLVAAARICPGVALLQ